MQQSLVMITPKYRKRYVNPCNLISALTNSFRVFFSSKFVFFFFLKFIVFFHCSARDTMCALHKSDENIAFENGSIYFQDDIHQSQHKQGMNSFGPALAIMYYFSCVFKCISLGK